MGKFIFKKLLQIIPMLLLISFIVFVGLDLTPMDPINYMVSPDMVSNTANLDALRESMGLNDPLFIRYIRWLGNLLTGEFGYSITSGRSIRTIISSALPATFELALVSLGLSTVVGIILGIIAAVTQNGIIDNILRFFAVFSTSIPTFFFGIIILYIFALNLGLLPIGGRISIDSPGTLGRIVHLILPAVTMSIGLIPALLRYTRNSMLDVMNMDYVKTARSKGVSEIKVYIKHIFRNALIPILVLLVFRLPQLVSGSVIIESVFSWPGIGRVITDGVNSGDYPVIMVTTLMIAVVMLFASLLIDIFTALLDPRVRFED